MSGEGDYDVKRCAKCAAWIPSSASMCAYCNTTSPDEPLARKPGTMLSMRHGFSMTRILIVANVVYFVFSLLVQFRFGGQGNPLQWAITGSGLGRALYASGAYDHAEVVRDHQWWRVIGAAFLHVGGIHLAINMWSLHQLGTLAEGLFGTAKFVTIYVATAICSSLADSIWYAGVMKLPDEQVPGCAGASGAIFGIAGLLVAYLLRAGTTRGRQIAKSIGQSVLAMLVFGAFSSFISQTGHVGGLLPGIAFGLLVRADFAGRADVAAGRRWAAAASLGLALCLVSLVAAAWHAIQLSGGR